MAEIIASTLCMLLHVLYEATSLKMLTQEVSRYATSRPDAKRRETHSVLNPHRHRSLPRLTDQHHKW